MARRRATCTATPTAERMQAVLAQVHEAIAPAAEVDDPGINIDPALAACVQLALADPHLAPPPEPATRPPLTVSAGRSKMCEPLVNAARL